MLKRKPLAAALAALSFAAAGPAVAEVEHWKWIDIQSVSMPTAAPAPAAPRDVAAPGTAEPIGLLVPAMQKVREAAARMSSELTPEERAAYVRGSETLTVGGARTETVKAGPLTPLDDARLKVAPAPNAAWYAKFDGVDGSSKQAAPARATNAYLQLDIPNTLISSYQTSATGRDGIGAGSRATPKLMQYSAQGVHLPGPPQRSPVADGASSTLMAGEKAPPLPTIRAAGAIRR